MVKGLPGMPHAVDEQAHVGMAAGQLQEILQCHVAAELSVRLEADQRTAVSNTVAGLTPSTCARYTPARSQSAPYLCSSDTND